MRIVFYRSEPDFLFLSDHFRHLRKSIFSHRQLKYIFCFHIQLLTVWLQYFFAICHCREVNVFVMLMYFTNFRHHMLALLRRSAVLFGSVILESSVIPSFSIQSKPKRDLFRLSSPKFSIVLSSVIFYVCQCFCLQRHRLTFKRQLEVLKLKVQLRLVSQFRISFPLLSYVSRRPLRIRCLLV